MEQIYHFFLPFFKKVTFIPLNLGQKNFAILFFLPCYSLYTSLFMQISTTPLKVTWLYWKA